MKPRLHGWRLRYAIVHAFYDALLARGKNKMQANVAVMRKLLHAIYGMTKHGQAFDPEKFYCVAA